MSTIYKGPEVKKEIMKLYDEKLACLVIPYQEIDIDTQFGKTHIIKAGNPDGKPVVLLHGFNAGAPLTLEAVQELSDTYCFYAIDTIGQTTKSAETRLSIKNDEYALWVDEVLEKLGIQQANMVGISYGAFILQKFITHKPERASKCIFVVPSGLVSGNFWESTKRLTLPFMRFKITKKDVHLKAFTDAFAPEDDAFMFRLLKLIMTGTKLDTRIPALLKKEDVAHYTNPVYILAATNDVYFPGEKIAKKCPTIFNNLKEVHLLNGSKHMPTPETFSVIQEKLREWIG